MGESIFQYHRVHKYHYHTDVSVLILQDKFASTKKWEEKSIRHELKYFTT